MNMFGELADQLTELAEELEGSKHAELAKPLCAALQRAYICACKADRMLRIQTEAEDNQLPLNEKVVLAA